MRGYFIEDNVQLDLFALYGIRLLQQNSLPTRNRPRHWKPNAWPIDVGRDEATRTPDPYVPNVVRYQLRYIPMPKRMPMTNRNIAYATGFLRLNAVQRYCKNLNNVQMKRKY